MLGPRTAGRSPSAQPRHERRARLAAFGPAVAMLIVAGVHFRLSYVDGLLTPWRGGGFGMFATVDSAANRTVRIELSTAGGVRRVAPVVPLDGVIARSFPSTAHLVRLARAVLLRHCVAEPDWVRVTVSKAVFDRDSGVARALPVNTLTLRERPPCSEQ